MYKFYCDDLNLQETLDCGQAFGWEQISQDCYQGFALDEFLIISQNGNEFICENIDEEKFYLVWYNYFDLGTNYSVFKKRLCSDRIMKEAINYSSGIRILRQNPWETLVSFIISQNNNIKRIKGIISNMRKQFSRFPTPEDLRIADLTPLKTGFREKYLKDAAEKIFSNSIDLKTADFEKLKEIKGVGNKVAACVMLYGYYELNQFPVDVWIKKALDNYYPEGFPNEFDDIKGIAQLYLFNYIRNNNCILL